MPVGLLFILALNGYALLCAIVERSLSKKVF